MSIDWLGQPGNTPKRTPGKTPLGFKKQLKRASLSTGTTDEGIAMAISVNLEEDDLNDNQIMQSDSPPKKVKSRMCSTSPKKTPHKKCMSVAGRFTQLPSQFAIKTPPLANDHLFFIEKQKADRDAEAARQMLMHAQQEADLAKQRLESEEVKCKTAALQKQAEKDNKKLVRYE